MASPAWNHRRRVLAAQRSRDAERALRERESGAVAQMTGDRARFELLLVELENNCKRISDLPSGGEARIQLKKELLEHYRPLIDEYVSNGVTFENPLLVRCMIWCFDVGDIARGSALARIAVEQKQPMPFKSSARVFWADEVFSWAVRQFVAKKSVEPFFFEQLAFVTGDAQALYHEEIRIKYRKFNGLMLEKSGSIEDALEWYESARAVNPDKAKVKTVIAKLTKALSDKK